MNEIPEYPQRAIAYLAYLREERDRLEQSIESLIKFLAGDDEAAYQTIISELAGD